MNHLAAQNNRLALDLKQVCYAAETCENETFEAFLPLW
jgi:hypothetical protein